jgi:hypothetical protein
MTTYDELWTTFLNRCKISDIDLPQSDEKIYDTIHGAVLSFNNRLRDDLGYDDTTEQFDRQLNNDELLILAHYIRHHILENQLIFFTNTWQPFQQDIGIKNFSTQLKTLEELVAKEERKIDSLIINTMDDFL